jgi:biopolymer transport protein ExbD
MKFKRKIGLSSKIPTASLPDIIFMLLIFFMVATVMKKGEGLQVLLPDAEMIKKIPVGRQHISTIWVDNKNQIVCDDVEIKKMSDLRNVLYEKRAIDPQLVIDLKVHRDCDWGIVSDIQQEMRKASCFNVNYSAIQGVF